MTRLRLNIRHIVLRGFSPADREALLAGLHEQLSITLADPATRAAWSRAGAAPVLKLGRLNYQPGPSGSRKFGAGVATALDKGLRK